MDDPLPFDPSWSPSGDLIAYSGCPACWPPPNSGQPDIFVVDADGNERGNLTRTPDVAESQPAWSPDGGRIAYVRDEQVWVMNADGTAQTRLAATGRDVDPTWSPDGSRIAFTSRRTGSDEIWTMNARGEDLRRLTADRDLDVEATWSPDGRTIVWVSDVGVSDQGPVADLWAMDAATGANPRRLTATADFAEHEPVWSPDGSAIAFVRWSGFSVPTLAVINSDGGGLRLIGFGMGPDWQRINRLPTASFIHTPELPRRGATVTFASRSADPDGPVTEAWDLDNDGAFDDHDGPTASVQVGSGASRLVVRLRVVDRDGATDVASRTIDIPNGPPHAGFEYSPSQPRVGEPVVFTSTSSDPDGALASIAWDLDDDGSFDDGSGTQVAHTFGMPGTVSVAVSVTDADGAADVARSSVNIAPAGRGAGESTTAPGQPTSPTSAPLIVPPSPAGGAATTRDSATSIARVAVVRVGLERALRRGVRVRLRLNEAARLRVSARVATRIARRMRIPRRVAVGRATGHLAPGDREVVLVFTPRAQRLARLSQVRLTLRIDAVDRDGHRQRLTRVLTLRR